MSPRSEEFMAMALDALGAARATLDAGHPSRSVSEAYFAMLYAARAALSEEELNAKTHRGTWQLFREAFVEAGRFDRALAADAQRTQRVREGTDYDAVMVPLEEAQAVIELADRFVAAVSSMLD